MKIEVTDHGKYYSVHRDKKGDRIYWFRYSAIDADTYDGVGSPQGWGTTPEDAVRDLEFLSQYPNSEDEQ